MILIFSLPSSWLVSTLTLGLSFVEALELDDPELEPVPDELDEPELEPDPDDLGWNILEPSFDPLGNRATTRISESSVECVPLFIFIPKSSAGDAIFSVRVGWIVRFGNSKRKSPRPSLSTTLALGILAIKTFLSPTTANLADA